MLLWHTVGEGTIEGTIEGIGTLEGGNVVAFLPVLGYGLMAGASALGIVNFGWDTYQKYQRMIENERYWNDYYENTGISPLYPYRAGSYNDWFGTALDVSEGILNLYGQNKKRYY